MCGCSGSCSCSSTSLPIGPKGDNGTNGRNGDSGTNGKNGSTVIYSYANATGVSTPATLVETVLGSFNIPANTLSSTGDQIDIYIYCTAVKSASDDIIVRLKLAGLTIRTVVNDGTGKFIIKIKIDKNGVNSQYWTEEFINTYTASSQIDIEDDSSSATETIANLFQITGQCSSDHTSSLTLKKLVIIQNLV